MNRIKVISDQYCFFLAAPTFDLVLPIEGIVMGGKLFAPDEFDRTATAGVCIWIGASFVFSHPAAQVFGHAGVVRAICAQEQVDEV